MTIEYRVFENDGSGGPVDYSTPVATVAGPPYVGPPLASPSDTTFAVRSYDPASGLDDMNRDVVARVVIDASGADASATPAPPLRPSASPSGATTARATWTHSLSGRAAPTGFRVWATGGGAVDYSSPPAATAAYSGPYGLLAAFSATLTGLTPGGSYSVGVRAFNAAGAEANTASAPLSMPASPPGAVEGLTVAVISGPARHASAIKA